MIPSQIKSGIIRQVADRETNDDDLAELVVLLLDALEIPEVAERVADYLAPYLAPRPAPVAPRSSPPGLGRKRAR